VLDSIYVGMSGLTGYSQGLRVIANNSANMNTPGFKSSSLQFADQFYSYGNLTGGQIGHGLNTYSTQLNFKAGELRKTGNDLDLAVDGVGMFVLKGDDGNLRYSRAGQFEFNTDDLLVNRADGSSVMARGTDGALTSVSLTGLRTNAASATKTVTFAGNVSSTETEVTIGGIKVLDGLGAEHTLSLKLTNDSATADGSWKAELFDGTASVGTSSIVFADGQPTAATAKMTFTYQPAGVPDMPLTLDFSADVTSYASGSLSSLASTKQDGYAAGALTNVTFDSEGALALTYSNGQTVSGSRLALARFDTLDSVEASGDNAFTAKIESDWTTGWAGDAGFGTLQAGSIEISNVDLSQEFSDLVIMQRGYQASSQIVSTANDMIQELFSMSSR